MDDKNKNPEDDKFGGMTPEEWYHATDPNRTEDDCDTLPEAFLEEEDMPNEINVLFIPNYRVNESVVLDNYVDTISKVRNKKELKSVLRQLWDQAEEYGSYSERLDRLQEDIEVLQIETGIMNGDFKIVEIDDGEDE